MSSRVGVMYLGRIIEVGDVRDIFDDPDHTYTQALMVAVPVPDAEKKRRDLPLRCETPQPINLPIGCRFNLRCPYAFDRCFKENPTLFTIEPGHGAACFLYEEFHTGRLERGRLPSE